MFRRTSRTTRPAGHPRVRTLQPPPAPVRDRYTAALAVGWRPLG
jgi:hypothetical protein